MRILFFTNRNILTTSGELRLIKNRAEALYKIYNVITDFVVIQKKKRIFSKKQEVINAGGSKICVPSQLNFIKVFFDIYYSLKKCLSSKSYDVVVLSGPGMIFWGWIIKKIYGIPIIVDIHGASEDILYLNKMSPFLKKLKSLVIYTIETLGYRFFLNRVDGMFVVTDALSKYICERYKVKEKNTFIVPCGTIDTQIDSKEYTKNRG